MDTRKACLLLYLLLICLINATAVQNGWGRPNNIRRVRKISEYLVPPPPPRFSSNRIPRVANYQSTEQPGYFMRFMSLLNPFSSDSSQPPLPPPLPLQPKIPYPSTFIQNSDPLPAATNYNGPPPIEYEKPPLPPPSNDHSGYPIPSIKARSCNSCNKVPWIPMHGETHSGDASYASSSQSVESSPHGEYLTDTREVPYYDAYHAASQEIRVPDYAFNAPLPSGEPVPDPLHVYPGALPPLFNQQNFNYSVDIIPNPLPASISGNGIATGPSGEGVVSQQPGYINPSGPQSSGVFNNGGYYDVTGLGGSPDGSVYNASQINQEIPNSYEKSDFNRESYYNNQKNYLPTNANVAESSLAPVYSSSGKIEDSIKFESVRTTMAPEDKYFVTRQDASTESDLITDYFQRTTDTAEEENATQDEVKEMWGSLFSPHRKPKKNKQLQVIIPYTSQHTPLPFQSPREISNTNESNHDNYIGEASNIRAEVVSPPNSSHIQFQPTTLSMLEDATRKPFNNKKNNVIDRFKLQKNIDNWTIQEYSKGTTVSTIAPSSDKYFFPSKQIPNEYLTTTDGPVHHVTNSNYDNVKTYTLGGFSFIDQEYKGSASNHMGGPQIEIKKTEKPSTESPTDAAIASTENTWQSFPVGISSVNRERVYIVTPQPHITTPRSNSEYRKEKTLKEAERDRKESKGTLQTDTKKTEKSDKFESIEKAYQVLPQAVNNLAVASTGPENVPLWGIMEHEEFASTADSEYDNDTESPTLYSKPSKESRARR